MANPTAMFLSCAMMLDWLADRHHHEAAARAAQRLDQAVLGVYRDARVRSFEFGGSDGTHAITRAVIAALAR